MRRPYYLRAKLNRSAIFAQAMRRAFPGDGNTTSAMDDKRVSASGEPWGEDSSVEAPPQTTTSRGCDTRLRISRSEPIRVTAGETAPFITEADIAAKVQNTVGTGPDFDTLLTDPDYDRRATAIPAAREEQE